MADLKGTIEYILRAVFSNELEFRYRPSFFPFTEPSIEVDMRTGPTGKWVEILGAGMVHPLVLTRVGYDPQKVQGFAFGLGVDRILALRHGISDIRTLYNGDARVSKQFIV